MYCICNCSIRDQTINLSDVKYNTQQLALDGAVIESLDIIKSQDGARQYSINTKIIDNITSITDLHNNNYPDGMYAIKNKSAVHVYDRCSKGTENIAYKLELIDRVGYANHCIVVEFEADLVNPTYQPGFYIKFNEKGVYLYEKTVMGTLWSTYTVNQVKHYLFDHKEIHVIYSKKSIDYFNGNSIYVLVDLAKKEISIYTMIYDGLTILSFVMTHILSIVYVPRMFVPDPPTNNKALTINIVENYFPDTDTECLVNELAKMFQKGCVLPSQIKKN